MFYKPEAMIYLWILPVFGMIILPALWSITCMFYRFMERSRLSDVRGFLDLASSSQEDNSHERRNHQRIQIQGPKACVAQQVKCCQTYIANVSPQGICLQNIPRKMFNDKEGALNVVFKTKERNYSMLVKPKWRKATGKKGYMVGAEIVKMPAGWLDFINNICQPVAMGTA